MLRVITAAILYLAPHVSQHQAKRYADSVWFEARWYRLDPLMIVAIAHAESEWNQRARSPTGDYGLMQIHVDRKSSNHFWGRKKLLLLHRFNIREGARKISMWKRYHYRRCRRRRYHPYWAHYKWGSKIKSRAYDRRVLKIYRRIKNKLGLERKRVAKRRRRRK